MLLRMFENRSADAEPSATPARSPLGYADERLPEKSDFSTARPDKRKAQKPGKSAGIWACARRGTRTPMAVNR
jgi:hypothetical protein